MRPRGSDTDASVVYVEHAPDLWRDFPELVAGVVCMSGITASASVDPQVAGQHAIAESRLATSTESELPEVQAWRRAYSRMGLEPTQ